MQATTPDALPLTAGQSHLNLNEQLVYHMGKGRSPADMVSLLQTGGFDSNFIKVAQGFEPYSDIWSAVALQNVSKPNGRLADHWILTYDAFAVRDVEIYLIRRSGESEILLSFSSAEPYDPALFSGTRLKSESLILRPQETGILMIKTSKLMAQPPTLAIMSEPELINHDLRTVALNAAFYTIAIFGLMVMLGINISLKSSVGIKYAILFSLLLLALSFDDNIPLRFLYPGHPEWNADIGFLVSYAYIMFGFYVAGSSMVTRKGSHPWSRQVKWFALLPLATLVLVPFLPRIASYKIQLIWTGIMCVSHFLPLYWWEKSSNRKLIEMWVGLTIILIAYLVYAFLTFIGYLENQIILRNFSKITFVVIGTLVMLGLTYGIISLRREHDRAQQEKIRALEQDSEKSQRLLEAEKNYSRARDQAALRQRQLATASHDIRQPLSSLRMSLNTVAEKMDGEVQVNIREALDYLESLSSDYLTESRPEPTEQIEEATEPYQLSILFQTVEQMFREEAISKGLKFLVNQSSIETTIPPLTLMRIISNLVSNAIKYTDNGKVLLGARRRESGFVIEIWDSGRGMSDEEIVRFQSAYQKSDVSEGEGLGLAICHDLARQHGLRLEVTSTPGNGTRMGIVIEE